MSKAQLVITAVVLEGRSKTAVAPDYDVSRQWVHQLVARYQAQGAAAFAPRSRRPHTNAHAISPELEERIVRLRKTLDKAGYDAGAATIAEHLARDPDVTKVPPCGPKLVPKAMTSWPRFGHGSGVVGCGGAAGYRDVERGAPDCAAVHGVPSGFGGGFAAPPPSGEIVTDERELLGEVVSVGAVFAELLHADSMLAEWSPVALVEDVA
jgi:Homeodomain-like domain